MNRQLPTQKRSRSSTMKTEELAVRLLEQLKLQGKTLATAESCTGGGIGKQLTSIPGSSSVYAGGVISYTNQVKNRVLSVSEETLETVGAVSAETAEAMAQGVRIVIGADIGISVTGLAGPDSDGSGKPVGLVYVAATNGIDTLVQEYHFQGNREAVRSQAVHAALQMGLKIL